MITNAFSVDVEEYYHAAIFRAGAGVSSQILESRVERSVDLLLGALHDHCARATFFVLGEIAARHPGVVRRIQALGHEIACHGDRHISVSAQTPAGFHADIHEAKSRIEDVIGERVIGYRAPNFSIGRDQRWAFPILASEGFEYDSSVFPIHHDRYGEADAPRFPYTVWREGSASLVEFPIGTTRLCGMNLPIGGGGHFRVWPFALTRYGIQRVNIRERQPVMFYLHPWELDDQQPRPPMPWKHRFRHYVGVRREPAKVGRLLAHFSFAAARDVLEVRRGRAAGIALPHGTPLMAQSALRNTA